MPAIQLTSSERKAHRADAHHLDPVVAIGGDGLTDAVVRECDMALNAHGLVKVRVFADDRSARDAMFVQLADRLNAAPVQHIGKLLVLWRPVPEKAPVERDTTHVGPRVVKILKFSKSGNHRAQVKKITILGNQRLAQGGELKRSRKRVTSVKKTAAE